MTTARATAHQDLGRHLMPSVNQDCLHDLIEAQAQRTPSRVAVRAAGAELTYAELCGRANQLARCLRARGVAPRSLVAICVERSLDLMVGLLGILKTGAAYVPLDPAYPQERRRAILEDGRVGTLLSRQSLADAIAPYAGETFFLDTQWAEVETFPARALPGGIITPEDRAYVMFTSGSTGRPKGVQIPHRAVVNLLTCMRRELSVDEHDVMIALASCAFDMCIPELYLPLIAGATVVIGEQNLAADGERLWRVMQDERATIMQATPTTWSLLVKAGFVNRGMRMIVGAEPLPLDIGRQILERTDRLYNFYGPTETTVWSTYDVLEPAIDEITIGRPLDNQQVYLVDRQLNPVAEGDTGELLIAGDGLAIGYLGQPGLTAEKFIPNAFSETPGARLYRTSDLARVRPDGRLAFSGRADHQVKIRGYRIELGEIESALRRFPLVADAVVIAREDDGLKRLVAYVVAAPAEGESGEGPPAAGLVAEELRSALALTLPDYMLPEAFVTLDHLPRLPNGKISRNLPAPAAAPPRRVDPGMAPRTPTETFLAAAWSEVLRLDGIGKFEDVFALGAHSLLVTQVASRARSTYGIELSVQAIFDAPTIAELASEVDRLIAARAPDMSRGARESAPEARAEALLAERIDTMSEAELDAALADIAGERITE